MIKEIELRAAVGRALGFGDNFDGNQLELSPQDRERLSIGTVRYVLLRPEEFDPERVRIAKVLAAKQNFGSIGNYTDADWVSTVSGFLRAYASTAGEFIEGTAGVAGRSLKALGIDLGFIVALVAVGALVYFGAPYVLPRLRAAFKKAPKP